MQNGFCESLNGRLRAECLNAHWFLTLADAREELEDRRRYYNEDRPPGAIGNKPRRRAGCGDGSYEGNPGPTCSLSLTI